MDILIVIGGVMFWGYIIYKFISDPKAWERFKSGKIIGGGGG